MRSRWLAPFFLGASLAPFSVTRATPDPCVSAMSAVLPNHPEIFENLRRIANGGLMSDLSAEMKAALREHPIWRRASADSTGGAELEFSFLFSAHSGGETLKPGEVKHGQMGESIQSHFIAALLKELYPRARLYADRAPAPPGHKKIPLFLMDGSERGMNISSAKAKHGTDNWIDMPLAKAANARAIPESKEQVRQAFGIKPNQFVITDYNFHLSYNQSLPTFIQSLPNRNAKDLIIFESGRIVANGPVESERALKFGKEKLPGFVVHLLTELKAGDLSGPGPHFIINNTKGMMPAINRAADVMLMEGPMNLFEGLASGTPTVFVNYTGERAAYNLDTYNHMKRIALATGGAFAADDEASALALVAKLSANPPSSIHNPSLVQVDGPSAFTALLDELDKLLERALNTGHGAPQRP